METANYQTLKPTFSDSFNYGWEVMKRDFLRLFLVVIVAGVAAFPIAMIRNHEVINSAGMIILSIIGVAYFFMVYPVFRYSASLLFLQSVRKEAIDIKNIIKGFDNYLNVILANLLTAALIGIAFIALFIPGIIVACRLAFVPYLVMDKNLDPVAAVEESWRMTRGIGWTIFGMAITSFFIAIGGLILIGIGIFPAIIWIRASFATLYQAALQKKENGNGVAETQVVG